MTFEIIWNSCLIDKHGFEMVRYHSALIKNQYDPKIIELYMKEI